MMLKVNVFAYTVVLSTALAMLMSEVCGEVSEEARRGHRRRKKPCGKESPRWFLAHDITVLVGDLTVVNSVPCGAAGVVDKPVLQRPGPGGHKPGLLGSHQGGGLLGSHHQGGGLLGGHHQGGGLFGSHHQGGGLFGNHQGGGLFGNHQGGGLFGNHQGGGLFGNHQGGGLFGNHHQGGGLFGSHNQGGSQGVKPVYEPLEEESSSSAAPYKPGPVVGGLSGQVSGYEQDLSHLGVIERINEQVGRFIKPFVDLFLR